MFENKKVRTVMIVIGIILLVAGAYSSWSFRKTLSDENLSEDENQAYQNYYLISKLVFLAGFLMALVPSVKGALFDLEAMKSKNKEESESQNEK